MRDVRLGSLQVRLTGGSDREGGGDGPVVVLMHGFGAPGVDLVPLWRELSVPEGTRFAFPEGPLELDPGFADARAWWLIDIERIAASLGAGGDVGWTREVPEGLVAARSRVVEMLDALERELDVTSSRIVLGGFSQGAMLALDVALHSERSLAGLVLLSGSLIAEPEWTPLMPKRKGLAVFQSHGRGDPLLPFSVAERLRDALIDAGLDVRFIAMNGGHEISGGVLDELGAFLSRVLTPR